MDNIVIENMTPKQLESISDILETEFDNFWTYNILKNELNNPHSKIIVAKINDEIVGFSSVSILLDTAEITNIVIKKIYRGKGFSSVLLKEIIDTAKSNNCKYLNLEVNSNNIIAINLYKKFNFKQVGLRKNYYTNGDAILFTKNLSK